MSYRIPPRLVFIRLVLIVLGCVASIAMAGPVFSGAQGFGVDSPAGRGGRIIKVTNLNAAGAGSLREALETSGPRIVVFEVAGVIDLDKSDLQINEPFITIAGHTAPSPGISIIRGGMEIKTHDVLMQHIRFRIGDAGMPKKSKFEKDVSIEGPEAYNVIVDHCSVSWGTDELLSISGPRYNGPQGTAHKVTLSNNIIAEGLYDSTHSKGVHSMGTLVHDNVKDVAVISNLYANNNERNPWFKGNTTGVIVNNYIYNPGVWAIRLAYIPKEWEGRQLPGKPRVSIVGNFMQHGTNTPKGLGLVGTNYENGEAFLADNLGLDREAKPVVEHFGGITPLDAKPSWPPGLTAMPVEKAREYVLNNSGARPRDRDAVDRRIVADVRTGKGQFLNSQDEVGGYPKVEPSRRELKIPSQDVDAWLEGFRREVE